MVLARRQLVVFETLLPTPMIHVTCPSCQKAYRLGDAMAGKKVKCGQCRMAFMVQHNAPTAAESAYPDSAGFPAPARDEQDQCGAVAEAPPQDESRSDRASTVAARGQRPLFLRPRFAIALTLCLAMAGAFLVWKVIGTDQEKDSEESANPPAGVDSLQPNNADPSKSLTSIFSAMGQAGLLRSELDTGLLVQAFNEMAEVGCERIAIPLTVGGDQVLQVPDWTIGYETNHALMQTTVDRHVRNMLVRKNMWPIFRNPAPSIGEIQQVMGSPNEKTEVKGWATVSMDTGQVIQPGRDYLRMRYGPITLLTYDDKGEPKALELQIDFQLLSAFRKDIDKKATGSWVIDAEAYLADLESMVVSAKFTAEEKQNLIDAAPEAQFALTLNAQGDGDISWRNLDFFGRREGKALLDWKNAESGGIGSGVHVDGSIGREFRFGTSFLPEGEHLLIVGDDEEPTIRLRRIQN